MFDGQSVKVFPNPNRGIFQVQFIGNTVAEGSIEVMDAQGALVYKQTIGSFDQTSSYTIDLNGIASGVYFLRLPAEQSKQIHRIIIQ